MNYIIVNDKVNQDLKERYDRYCEEYNYTAAFDTYRLDTLSFDGIFMLFNRCWNKSSYLIVGKRCFLYLVTNSHYDNCLNAKEIKFIDNEQEYSARLAQTKEMPGEWDVIPVSEVYRIDKKNVRDISHMLELKASDREFYQFEENWKTWDLYNKKLQEAEEHREAASESVVSSVLLDNNIFTIRMADWKKVYQEGVVICIQFEGETQFERLGAIVSAASNRQSICVRCEDYKFVKAYMESKIGKICKTKVIDFGVRARLRRQREAMKRLFQEETANANMKDIIMGYFEYPKAMQNNLTMEHAYGLFGSNVRQKEAYLGALNANDIFLIQGPPGTGKTTIITEIVKYAIGMKMKVLVSSETHIAVDNVLERVQYMDNIVPIRFGSEKSVGSKCLRFMPEHISSSIISASKERLTNFEELGFNLKCLLKEKEAEWTNRILCADQEILKLQLQIPAHYSGEQLFEMIENFENLVYEANERYDELQREYKDFICLSDSLEKLQSEKNTVDALISTVSSGVMESGFGESTSAQSFDLQQCKKRAESLKSQQSIIMEKFRKNTYEVKKGPYQRRLRKIEREKAKLEQIIKPCQSFTASLHTVKNAIADIQVLQEQKGRYQQSLINDLEEEKAKYENKLELWDKSADIRAEWLNIIDHAETRNIIENIYMKKTNLVFATCSGIAAANQGNFATAEYDYVIIDEAAKCNMMDLIIPLVMGKKIILVGDHKQLYPMIETEGINGEMTKEQISILKEHILFKWLYEERIPNEFKIMLNRQYRMQHEISEFVSKNFYNGNLICEKEKNNEKSMMWIACESSEERLAGTSYENQAEAETIVNLVKKLDKNYTRGTSVGIICIYKAQANMVASLLARTELLNIEAECSTVDAFQGKEKHTIIFNTVRSNRATEFMLDENRVNVAVSRAQEFLYVVGKEEVVRAKGSGILGKLYDYIKQYGKIQNSRYARL